MMEQYSDKPSRRRQVAGEQRNREGGRRPGSNAFETDRQATA